MSSTARMITKTASHHPFGIAAALSLGCALNSCVHYSPRILAPAVSDRAYRQRSLNDLGLAAFVHTVRPGAIWQTQTMDLADASLVAAYFNPSLEIARSQLRTAEAGIVTAGGRPNPELAAGGGYETSPEAPVILRFQLSLIIETARKRSYRILEATKLADAARIGLNEASWRVYSQLRDAWMDHLASLDSEEAFRRKSQNRAEAASLIQARFSAGEVSRPQWDAERIQASRAMVALRAAEGQVIDTRIRLASAMGLPAAALAHLEMVKESDSPPSLEALSIPQVQRAGLLNRLDVQRSLLEYAAAEARMQLEVARQYPDIQLNPGYDFDEGHHKFTFGPTFPVPVWNRNRGAIADADARRREAEARFLALQSQVVGELERSAAGYATALAQFQEADRRWSVFQQSREQAMLRAVKVGEEDRLALNAIRLESVDAFQGRVEALAKTRAAFSALENAVQAPLGKVPWIAPGASHLPQREHQ